MQHNTATVERGILARVLRETGGNKAEAARLLHIDYKTIQLKIKVYGLQTDRARKGEFYWKKEKQEKWTTELAGGWVECSKVWAT